jgi:hypothetical protein
MVIATRRIDTLQVGGIKEGFWNTAMRVSPKTFLIDDLLYRKYLLMLICLMATPASVSIFNR